MKPGDKIGRYELGEQIGEGAMACVFTARHPVLERRVAIKILKKEACHDAQYVERFIDDARAANQLDDPNIVRVLDVDERAEQPFIVMELVDGQSLDSWLVGRRLEIVEAARIARSVALALATAHAAGVVHRDVKPSNILIDRRTGAAKLTDFGAAKRERPGGLQLTEMGQRIGTPRYMAPEQVEGSTVDPRTDLFALGATLYELLAGRPAFEGNTVTAVFHAILLGQPKPLREVRPDVPEPLAALVERMLAKSPDERPSSGDEIAAALDPYAGNSPSRYQSPTTGLSPRDPINTTGTGLGGDTTTKQIQTEQTPPLPPPKPPWLVPVLAGVALLIVAGLGAWIFFGDASDTPSSSTPPAEGPKPSDTMVAQGQPSEPPATLTPPPVSPPPTSPADDTTTAALSPGTQQTPAAPPTPSPQVTPQPEPPPVAPPVTPTPAAPAVTLECPANAAAAPGCIAAKDILATLGTSNAVQPSVALNRPDGIYFDQDYLVIEARMPPDLGGYLYVDVLTDQGSAYHLLPEPLRQGNALPAAEMIRIGVEASERAPNVRHWQASAPFGPGYIVVLATEEPLYNGLRPLQEPVGVYRDYVVKRLKEMGGGKAAHVERIEFRPRP